MLSQARLEIRNKVTIDHAVHSSQMQYEARAKLGAGDCALD